VGGIVGRCRRCQAWNRHGGLDGLFALTPALSLGEREEVGHFFGGRGGCGRRRGFVGWFVVVVRGEDGFFGAGDAAGNGKGFEPRVFDWAVEGDVGAEFGETAAEVEGGLEEEFGAHVVEGMSLQGKFDAGEVTGKVLELLFIARSILFLEFFDLHAFEEVDSGAMAAFPTEEGRFGNAEFVGDFAEAPAVGAEDEEAALLFGGIHNVWFFRFRIAEGVGHPLSYPENSRRDFPRSNAQRSAIARMMPMLTFAYDGMVT
jgi:hypothetical protein